MSDDKVALVTGASRGIGAAIAERFAADGWDLTISSRGREALESRAAELSEMGAGRVEVIPADMTDGDAVAELATGHVEAFGRCDTLVINAGMGQKGAVADLPVRRFDRLYQVNVRAPYILLQTLLPTLRATAETNGVAKVIAIASITGVYPEPELSAYGSTKAALISLCETFNLEESRNGVSATTIAPGYVDTDMSDWLKEQIPGDEMITVGDVATIAHSVTQLSRYAVLPNVVLTRPGNNLHRA
ncbi:SDR family NAD(P)-dependent oxidoreductase [Gordonia sp. SID5947]|uniref:SDR family NAD(P)-dependent oxidoreductase n=1 Tax=Gordonia sp. SID5947 TaxID=2690315 RepID=UPI00136B83EE|nr:SDR family oxidoreductase [Gordonia sp. SID5947]MYR07214.1 SDR family NAD(P)-dependent oxidoreductase [Gordonia sp. SID5947]